MHERQPLDRRDADAQAGERPGPDATANRSIAGERRAARRRRVEELARQPLGVRCASRRRRARRRAVSSSTSADASRARRRVQSRVHACDRLQNMSTSATPAMRQYLDAKQQHRDAILFFRMGDFYEMFYEDALVAARALELTLTSRSKDANGGGIPMCGVPFHAVDGYIARLVKKGFRVAICDQVEDPRKAKGIVKREVVRVVSPGTLTDASYLDAREPAFLMAVAPARDAATATRRRRRAARRLDRRVHRRRVHRRRRPAGARRRDRRAEAARDRRARRRRPGAGRADRRRVAAAGAADHADRRAGRSTPSGAAHAPRSAARRRARRIRPRAASGRRRRRRRARPLPARHAEGRSRARPRASPTASAPTRCSSIRRR